MTPEYLAEEYAKTIYGVPNGWGEYVHPTLGASHNIMARLYDMVGSEAGSDLIEKYMKIHNNGT